MTKSVGGIGEVEFKIPKLIGNDEMLARVSPLKEKFGAEDFSVDVAKEGVFWQDA